uniref:Uncharacterized protein n=1 Tax=Serinus canaria TaxID=9135 RepID=A0A8C9NBA6_SERCA
RFLLISTHCWQRLENQIHQTEIKNEEENPPSKQENIKSRGNLQSCPIYCCCWERETGAEGIQTSFLGCRRAFSFSQRPCKLVCENTLRPLQDKAKEVIQRSDLLILGGVQTILSRALKAHVMAHKDQDLSETPLELSLIKHILPFFCLGAKTNNCQKGFKLACVILH